MKGASLLEVLIALSLSSVVFFLATKLLVQSKQSLVTAEKQVNTRVVKDFPAGNIPNPRPDRYELYTTGMSTTECTAAGTQCRLLEVKAPTSIPVIRLPSSVETLQTLHMERFNVFFL